MTVGLKGKGVGWQEGEGKEAIQTQEVGEKERSPGVHRKGKTCLE